MPHIAGGRGAILELQRLIGNRSTLRILTSAHDDSMPIRRSVQGKNGAVTDPTDPTARRFRDELIGLGILSSDLTSPRNRRFDALVRGEKLFREVGEMLESFDDLPAEANDEPASTSDDDRGLLDDDEVAELDEDSPLEAMQSRLRRASAAQIENGVHAALAASPTNAVILWAGAGKIFKAQIEQLKAAYKPGADDVETGNMKALATTIWEGRTRPQSREEQEVQDFVIGGAEGVQQWIEQEVIQAEQIAAISRQLESLGAKVTVLRPPDSLLARPHSPMILRSWVVYTKSPLDALRQAAVEASKKTILVTVGHGGPMGHIAFPAHGLMSQAQVGELMGLEGAKDAVLYLPYQCFPGMALEAARVLGWNAQGIEKKEKSDDFEMAYWFEQHLAGAIEHWLG